MSFSARYLPAVLLTIFSLPISLWAQTTPKQANPKTPHGSISGRVTIKEKSAEGIVVSIRKSDFGNLFEVAQRATTDQDGFYRIANVPPGNYEVTPSAPALVRSDAKEAPNKIVLVGEDENIENINFALVRGGVITGKVTDADGRPVIQQPVNIYRVEVFEQQQGQQPRQFYSFANGQTDDRGIYRVYGLMPGRYKVAVGRSEESFAPSFAAQRVSYQQVFHPDVTDPAKGAVIEVGEGTEANNIDITLGRALQTFSVSGRVIDDKGAPVPNMRLGLQRNVGGQRAEFVNAFPSTNTQGDFVVEGLIPGKYGIFLMPNQNSGLRLETATLEITDQDLTGLTLKLVPGASVSGVLVFESENKAGMAKLPELQLRGYVTNPSGGGGLGSSAVSPVGPDGSFLISGLPGGALNFMLSGRSSPMPAKGFNIVRIERDGVPSQRSIEIKDGEQVTGVRVVLAYGTATLRGVINLENGTLPNGARFVVRITKLGETTPNRGTPVDARGHFLMDGLPPGVYEVQASIGGMPQNTPRSVKREINLPDGVTTDITITIDMTPTIPKP